MWFWAPLEGWAADQNPYIIVIKGHQFAPSQLMIPAGQKIKLTVDNQDPSPEEFESYDLNREKVVSGNKQIIVFIGPLKPGTYRYFGDFHKKTAEGIIKAQ
ncbi:MAG: cupredoxin domain-containing protein [Candidatus Omnitrophica bacterium]|nr:cupredoxin domain-containing protein [Candidatus Omnitrophota bacterium]